MSSAEGWRPTTGLEVVVLVDDGSASASEILAGALQDAGRAELVGERTFGKGTVQEWTQLPGGNGGFRLSIAKWLTRDKTWIDGTGLTPDAEVASSGPRYRPDDPAADAAADVQLQRAISLLLGEDQESAQPGDVSRIPERAGQRSNPVVDAGAGRLAVCLTGQLMVTFVALSDKGIRPIRRTGALTGNMPLAGS